MLGGKHLCSLLDGESHTDEIFCMIYFLKKLCN